MAERGRDLLGVESQLAAIDEACVAFEGKGFLSGEEIERVEAATGYILAGTEKAQTKLTGAQSEARRAELLAAFDDLRTGFEARRSELVARERRKREYRRQVAVVPSEQMVMRLTRYEAHLERQFYRAVHELERLQLRRAGEFVPPPVKVSVDINDR